MPYPKTIVAQVGCVQTLSIDEALVGRSRVRSMSITPMTLRFWRSGHVRTRSASQLEQLAPGELRLVAEHRARLFDCEERAVLGEVAADRDVWEDLRHQLAARPLHHRVGSGDDERLCAFDVRVESKLDASRDIALVDVALQVPFPRVRVVPVGREALVVGAFHDVREAEPDEWDATPAVELPGHLLAKHLRQRVRRLGAQVVLLVDRRVVGRPVERAAECRLARCPKNYGRLAAGGAAPVAASARSRGAT